MLFSKPQLLKDLAALIGAEFVGDPDFVVTGLNEVHKVQKGDLLFVDHPKYYDKALNSNATCILIDKAVDCPDQKALLISKDPFRDFNKLIAHFFPFIAVTEKMGNNVTVGDGTIIQPNCFIGNNVIIGKNCTIHSNVSIYDNCVRGDSVILHANVVIGSEAFYYQKRNGVYNKLLTCGRAIIEDDVEIGANSTIDKGVTGDTVIGRGTKIDNLVHVGHDTVVGKNCLFAAQVGIAGVTTIEDDVVLWGQVGVISDITIGKGAVVLAQSGVHKSLEGNTTYFGSPVSEARAKMKELAAFRKIPELIKKL